MFNLFSTIGYEMVSSKTLSELRTLSFEQRLKNIPTSKETINLLNQDFQLSGVYLSTDEIINFLQNQDDYPALRTLYRSIVYLTDTVNTTSNPPSRDRISDVFQFIEAAYCTNFVSKENELVKLDSSGSKLNPEIELLHVSDFIKELNVRQNN